MEYLYLTDIQVQLQPARLGRTADLVVVCMNWHRRRCGSLSPMPHLQMAADALVQPIWPLTSFDDHGRNAMRRYRDGNVRPDGERAWCDC